MAGFAQMESVFLSPAPGAVGAEDGGCGSVGRGVATWAEEEVTVGCLRLVLAHGEGGHVPPAELRRFIREAIGRFPCR